MSSINVGKVAMVPTVSIEVGERARQEMGDLQDLEDSLKKSGLIQPLAVREVEEGKYLLLAGERRYTILLANKVSLVPVRIYEEELSILEIKVIEKAENFYRKDMEYYEYDALVLEIHELQQEIEGRGAPGPGHTGHRLKDTAKMVGVTDVTVHTAIKRAEAREAFPELFENCKTQKDASNIIKKMDEAMVKETIAQKIERDKNGSSIVTKLSNCFILGDFFEGVKKIPDGVMHLVEIDSPYAIGVKEAKKKEGESIYSLEEYNEVPPSNFMDGVLENWKGMNTMFKECYRVMADHSWLLCWFGPEPWFGDIYNAILKAGFETTRMCGIWTKPSGQSKRPEMHLANSYEMFFYAWKGRPALNRAGRLNIFDYPPVPPQNKTHPTERPIELMKDIYDTFAFPGSRVFIPFLGSGSGLIAANELGMNPIGFELGKGYRDSFLVKVHGMR